MAWSIFEKLLFVNLVILTTCTIVFSVEHRKRYINSDHHPQIHSTFDPQKLIVNKNDEFTTEAETKISHGLMGGHKKITTTQKNRHEDHEKDEARWDDGLYLSSAGNGKEKAANHEEDDDKKTLAQQVKEGKYGLIQNEIYSKKPKRPGIISYLSNPDVPKDNIKNLGGLEKEDIWLAENHLLVLKGGRFPDQEKEDPNSDLQDSWPPIDDYQAPKRQVRIPYQPEVPPPFPVQLSDGGPIKIIGKNETDNYENGSQWIEGLIPFNSTSLAFSDGQSNETNDEIVDGKNKFGGLVGPFFPHLPPGAVFVPPPNNQTDYDEDDQSIYYPPPYSFKYNQDNTTAVPPGPLVPGIILPPPPEFFSQLEEKKSTGKNRTKCIRCTLTPSQPKYSDSKFATKSYKVGSSTTASTREILRPFTMKPINKIKYKTTSLFTETTTKYPDKPFKYISPTNKINTIEISEIQPVKSTIINQILKTKSEDQKNRWTGGYNKSRPIVAYYPISTPPPTFESVEATPVSLKSIINTGKKSGNSASYYFYEEANTESLGTTANPTVYFQVTTEAPVDKIKELSQPEFEKKKSYYNVEITPSQQTAEEYSVEVIEPIIKPSPKNQYSTFDSSVSLIKFPRAQGQRTLTNTSPLYYQDITERSQYNLFTTPSPRNIVATSPILKYSQKAKPKPIYQYSFQAINYPQQSRTGYNQEVVEQPPKQQVTFNEWQEIQEEGQEFDYSTVGGDERIEQPQYKNKHSYQTRVTTPNPTHAYYTKQDEQLFDDVTKEYFTNFGKKIKYQKLPSTTPIYGKSSVTERPIHPIHNSFITDDYEIKQKATSKAPQVKVFYGDQSNKFSIKDDIRINYQHPLPTINPDAEFIPGYNSKQHETLTPIRTRPQQNYHHYAESLLPEQPRLVPIINYNSQQQQVAQQADSTSTSYLPLSNTKNDHRNYLQQPISLAGDIAVNYHNPRPPINPDAEFINPRTGQAESSVQPRSYVTYRLPGDGGHVYFFTPVITQRQDGYLNSRAARGSRSPRQRRGPRV